MRARPTPSPRLLAAGLGLAGALALAGTGGAAPAAAPATLRPYASCDQLAAVARRRSLERLRVAWRALPVMAPVATGPDDGRASTPEAAPADEAAPVDTSQTNVQEAGVDEPDVTKNDGRHLYVLAAGAVQVLRLGGQRPERVGRLVLPGLVPREMLLAGDRLLVFATVTPAAGRAQRGGDVIVAPQQPVLALVDVSDPASPRQLERLTLEGTLVSARLTAGSVRVVTSSSPGPEGIVFAAGPTPRQRTLALRHNRRVIRRARAAAFLPRASHWRVGQGTRRGPLLGCDEVSRPPVNSGLGMLSVLTIDPARGLEPVDRDGVQTDAQTVYASGSALYVATTRWTASGSADDSPPSGTWTLIHRFDASAPGVTAYSASGAVPGDLIGQFAMSELDGRLRVASTTEPGWQEGVDRRQSLVTVLEPRAGVLARVGRVAGLGRGERIYAVRFIGAMGYVVTFRQTDPLHVVDLSDPTVPRLRGELQIPGYSAYLHPVGDGLLLGVGQDADEQTGRVQGTQVSLFSVADPDHPQRLAHMRIGGWSGAEYDHHAFLYWPATGLALLPSETEDDGGAVGVAVAGGALQRLGAIRHPGTERPALVRTVVAGDVVLGLFEDGLMVSELSTLAPRAWVALD